MKLTIPERFLLTKLIPSKGSFETLAIIDSLVKMLYPTEEEVKKYEIVQEDKFLKWNVQAATEGIDINFTEGQSTVLFKSFDMFAKAEELTYDQYLLYVRMKTEEKPKDN